MSKTSVLLAEDDAALRDLYSFILNQAGFEVRQAEDGNAALNELQRHRPDILITDVMMPGMTGLELIERVKKEEELQNLPVVLISAHKDFIDLAQSKGATEVIEKPIDVFGFVSTVLSLADRADQTKH